MELVTSYFTDQSTVLGIPVTKENQKNHFTHTYELKMLFWYISLVGQIPVNEVHRQVICLSVHLVYFTHL